MNLKKLKEKLQQTYEECHKNDVVPEIQLPDSVFQHFDRSVEIIGNENDVLDFSPAVADSMMRSCDRYI